MKPIKEIIKEIILSDDKNFKRFEMIENFVYYASEPEDVKFLVSVLRNDKNSVVRHEAAAQLLKIEQKKPWIMEEIKDYVINELLNVVLIDQSLVAKHESVEALSYIGDDKVLKKFNELIEKQSDENELLDTILVARDSIDYRISRKIAASTLGEEIIKDYSSISA